MPVGTKKLSLKRPVTSSDRQPVIGELEMIADGEKEGGDGYFVELGPSKQWVQIDLGARYALHAILAWHYHSQARVYRDVVVQVADDKDFLKGVTTVFNNDHDNSSGLGIGKDKEYIEVAEGRLFDPKGATGRYVRMYSNGNTVNDLNHYVEIEVYGTPVSRAGLQACRWSTSSRTGSSAPGRRRRPGRAPPRAVRASRVRAPRARRSRPRCARACS